MEGIKSWSFWNKFIEIINIRNTPTATGPNSYGKTKLGFCDHRKLFEKQLKEKAEKKDRPKQVEGKEEEDKKLSLETLKNLEKLYNSKVISKEFF